jgi:SAM-dependent methyltransferase
MIENADQKTYWNDVAGAKWVANQTRLDRLMAPLMDALLQEAVPSAGEQVLDVGCGCGDLSLRLADAVGPAGDVFAIDLSTPMLTHAAQREQALPPGPRARITWREADAMTQHFEPSRDLLVSRFGVMFFDDKARAFANLRKAAKPGGRFAFLTWRGRAEVEWFQRPLEWISPVLPMPEVMDGAVGPCGLADGEGTRKLLEDAGFYNVIAEPVDRALPIGESIDDAVALLTDTGPVAAQMRDADDYQKGEAKKLLRRGLERHAGADGRVELRGACWIYRGVL